MESFSAPKAVLVNGEGLLLGFKGSENNSRYNYSLELDGEDLVAIFNVLEQTPVSLGLRNSFLRMFSKILEGSK